MTADLGRSVDVIGTGDGEGEPRLKGLFRHRAPPAAEIDIVDCLPGVSSSNQFDATLGKFRPRMFRP